MCSLGLFVARSLLVHSSVAYPATLPTPTFVTVALPIFLLAFRSLSYSPSVFDAQSSLVSPFGLVTLAGLAAAHSLAFAGLVPSGVAFVKAESLTLILLKLFVLSERCSFSRALAAAGQ